MLVMDTGVLDLIGMCMNLLHSAFSPLRFWNSASFHMKFITPFCRSGWLNRVCDAGSFNKIWYLCGQHKIQYTEGRMNKYTCNYMYKFTCIFFYTHGQYKYSDDKRKTFIKKCNS